jgi:mannose-6-phosphate isomerase-like protein (cupin superfamily)
MPGGAGTPLHLHTGYEERIWVIDGSLTVWAGPETFTLRSGDIFAIPMNTPHTIQVGANGARALNITSPGKFAELIRRTGTPAHLATSATDWDIALFQAVTEEFGDIILGPPGVTPGS